MNHKQPTSTAVKTADLRIGNLVYNDNGKIDKAIYIHENKVGLCSSNKVFEEIKPIILTDEILLKCGFQLMNKWFDYELTLFRIGYITDDEYFQFEINGKVIDIKSLHQLQNIIYFNTGEELNVSKLL